MNAEMPMAMRMVHMGWPVPPPGTSAAGYCQCILAFNADERRWLFSRMRWQTGGHIP